MAKYTKNGVTIEAAQWRRQGDMPADFSTAISVPYQNEKVISNGAIVGRYLNEPSVSRCPDCGERLDIHGWIDSTCMMVCPGSYVVTRFDGKHISVSPEQFEVEYEKE